MDNKTALFDIERRDDGWAVIDVRLGVAAVSNGVTLTGMKMEDADDLADLLTNRVWRSAITQ